MAAVDSGFRWLWWVLALVVWFWLRLGAVRVCVTALVGVGGRVGGVAEGSRCRLGAVRAFGWSSEGVGEAEEHAERRVPGEETPADAAGGAHDLAGDVDERVAEGAELHGEQSAALLAVVFGPAG